MEIKDFITHKFINKIDEFYRIADKKKNEFNEKVIKLQDEFNKKNKQQIKDEKDKDINYQEQKKEYQLNLGLISNTKKNIDYIVSTLFNIPYESLDDKYFDNIYFRLNKIVTLFKRKDKLSETNAISEKIKNQISKESQLLIDEKREKLAKSKIESFNIYLSKEKSYATLFLIATTIFSLFALVLLFRNNFYIHSNSNLSEILKLISISLIFIVSSGLAMENYQSILKLNNDRQRFFAIDTFSKLLDKKQEKLYIEKYLKSIIDDDK